MTTLITTVNGTVYEISRTQTQDIVVRWDDPDGNPHIKGSAVKVIEFCRFVRPMVGQSLEFQGKDRYTLRDFAWKTSAIKSIVRNGESLQSL